MFAREARKITIISGESKYRKVYAAIKHAAERGRASVRVIPCAEWSEFYEHFTSLEYTVSEYYYHCEDELYAEIKW